MVFNRFAARMIVRVVLLTLALTGLSVALTTPGFYGATLLSAAVAAVVLYELYRYVSRTNAELTRFLEAARYQDFGQRFGDTVTAGAGFERLYETFGEIMQRFKADRRQQEETIRRLESLTEHVPVPLFSLHGDNGVTLHNNAARRLFGNNKVGRFEDLKVFGETFAETVRDLKPGERRLVNFSYDGVERQLAAVASQLATATAREKLVSVQDIQSELDDAQLQAWRDMVRVLTHEIMNSVTPVASLAKTASELVNTVREVGLNDGGDAAREALEDARAAVDTVARRSEGLMDFVQSYRSLALQPVPQKQRLVIQEVFKRLEALVSQRWADAGIELTARVEPDTLTLEADPGLLEQVLINLLTNAEQALESYDRSAVTLSARLNRRGHVLIEVADNGPGIPAEVVDKIFVPFFTTRRGGTGVGLALTRQVMVAHGGGVTVGASDAGGARFTLIF